ncbi:MULTISPECIES: NADPH-dependent FMN reductase [unclassified Adlercreutzia]|uniref:NADPH-dependent FMN reductase n=1 Tax=unclassified Adlercreutzia TaxID=2636013 RepID=UPI00197FCB71|nr:MULTISPECIES: NADPH-dependent FMN reductase [unclassified Adlercreutzia]
MESKAVEMGKGGAGGGAEVRGAAVDAETRGAAACAAEKSVLMVVGSLRARSLNRQLAERAAAVLRGCVRVSFLEYADLPHMNQDVEVPVPEPVQRVRDAVEAADGLWIVTPEYNHGLPGVLKNLLDWLSRPVYADGTSVMRGKPVTYSGAAGSSQARYAFASLWTTLDFMGADVIDVMPTGVLLDRRAYSTDRLVLAERDRESLELQANLLLMHMGVPRPLVCRSVT